MKRNINCLMGVVGVLGGVGIVAARAEAGLPELKLQVSVDGVNWGQRVEFEPLPGVAMTVLMRAKVRFIPAPREPMPIAFGTLTWQPVLSNIQVATDRVLPFALRGLNTNGGAVTLDNTPLDGPFGRISPFAASGPSTSQSYVVHTHTGGSGGAPLGNYYRIARNDISRWMGLGPTTGPAAVNNFNGAGGVVTRQKLAGRDTFDPAISYELEPVTFQIGLEYLSSVVMERRVIGVGAPIDGLTRNSENGARIGRWVRDLEDRSGAILANVVVVPAEIVVIPSPGVAGVVMIGAGMLGLVGVGRRRQRAEGLRV